MLRLFDPLRTLLALLLLLAGLWWARTGDYFGREILAEMAVFAIAAMGLDLLAGFPRLVSMGHGLFVGIGAYGYAVATALWGWSWPAAILLALALSALAGLLVGLATVRARDVFYIMATLAFGQMGYVWVVRSAELGGDDGLAGVPRPELAALGLDLSDSATFATLLVLLAAAVYLLLGRLLASGFGRTLVAIGQNERRVRALGIAPGPYRVAATTVSGTVAGFAGVLAAMHSMYVSPELFHWTWSGEVLTMAILGGVGSLVGPALGAAAVVWLKYAVSGWTEYWGLFLGLFLILAVWTGGQGLYGYLERLRAWLLRTLTRQEEADARGDRTGQTLRRTHRHRPGVAAGGEG